MPKSKPKPSTNDSLRKMAMGLPIMALSLGDSNSPETKPKEVVETNVKSEAEQKNIELEKRIKILEHQVEQLQNKTKTTPTTPGQANKPSWKELCKDVERLKNAAAKENTSLQSIDSRMTELFTEMRTLGERLEDFVQSEARKAPVIQTIVHATTSSNSLAGDRETNVYTSQTSTTSTDTDFESSML